MGCTHLWRHFATIEEMKLAELPYVLQTVYVESNVVAMAMEAKLMNDWPIGLDLAPKTDFRCAGPHQAEATQPLHGCGELRAPETGHGRQPTFPIVATASSPRVFGIHRMFWYMFSVLAIATPHTVISAAEGGCGSSSAGTTAQWTHR